MGLCLSNRTSVQREGFRKSNRVGDLNSSRNDQQFSTSLEHKEQVFQVKRETAEEMLKNTDAGVYLFSYDITSDLFISVSHGSYVSHHAISKTADGSISIGGEQFNSTGEMVNFFKTHVIGSTTLSFELTSSDNSVKKETSKGSRSKSENSWNFNTISSLEASDAITGGVEIRNRKIEQSDNQRHDIIPVKEEKIAESNQTKLNPTQIESLSIKSIEQSVSSAGEMDLPVNEPLPILPEPTGRRPPPLAPFSEAHFRSIFKSTEVNQIIKFLMPKDCSWASYLSTKMIKIILCGTRDTETEREHFVQESIPDLLDFSYKYGFCCDVTYFDVSSNETRSSEWEIEAETMILSSIESSYLKKFGIPVLVVLFTSSNSVGNKLGPLTIPKTLTQDDFDKIISLLSNEEHEVLNQFYSIDHNDLNKSHIIRNGVINNAEKMKNLQEICLKLLAKCFEGEDDLWKLFAPEIERNLETMTKNYDNLEIILVEKKHKVAGINSDAQRSSKEYHDNNHDGNLDYRLSHKENNCILKLKEDGIIMENDIINVNADEGNETTVNGNILSSLKSKVMKIITNFTSERRNNHFLDEEIFSNFIDCHTNLNMNFPQFDVIQTIKAYIEGPFKKPLILYGGIESIQSYLIAKTTQLALYWFGENACIVTRLVGTTEDSTSLRLLLRSICLQISLAYNTDPTSVPQDLSELVQFLPSLFRFATDSQPLVICIAGLSDIEIYDKEFECFQLIPNNLCDYVKIVTSIDVKHLSKAKEIYKDKNSFKQIDEDSSQNALEMIDRSLISANRTISDNQKKAISDLVSCCHSPVFVKLLSDQIGKLHSYDDLKLTAKESVDDHLLNLLKDAETEFGEAVVKAFCSLVTLSKFGVSKRCIRYVLLHEEKDGIAVGKLDNILERILRYFSSIIRIKWANELLLFTWFDLSISDVIKNCYLSDSSVIDRIVKRVLEFFINEPNQFQILNVENQKSSISDHTKSFNQSSKSKSSMIRYNLEKLLFLPFFCTISKDINAIKKHALCSFGFLFDKLRALSVSHLLNDLTQALVVFSQDIDLKTVMELLELSTDALTVDSDQFSAQIVARMNSVERSSYERPMKDRDGDVWVEEENGPTSDEITSKDSVSRCDEDTGQELQDEKTSLKLSDTNERKLTLSSSMSIHLAELVKAAMSKGHYLMPSHACFIRPPSDCGMFKENQISSFWSNNDSRILFIANKLDKFITWSAKRQTVMLYDSNCNILRTHRGVKLKRVLLAHDMNIIIEMADKTYQIYGVINGDFIATLDSNQRYFAVCDLVHVAAMSAESTCLSVYNVRSCQVIWQFHAPNGRRFHNVLISKNGAIAACILEVLPAYNDNDDNCKETSENQIIVLNLKSRQLLHTIILKRDQLFNELCAISEDGHYLAYISETGYHILVWDLIKGSLIQEIEARLHRVLKILISSQGNCLLTVSADSILRLWNLSNGKLRFNLPEPISSIRGGYMDDTHCLSMSEDGSRAVHSLNSRFHCSYVVLWDLIEGIRLATLTTDFYGLSYEISPDGRYVISCMPSGVVTLCNLE